jgi:predicted enzyme related to lactoylglutathione lyase
MHRSRLAGFIIDCQVDDLESAAEFWSRALGYRSKASQDPDDADYVLLDTAPDQPHVEVQRVSHPSRVHLDIEADDLEAEVERLEKLGARRLAKVKRWWVLEAPTGHRFCVVTPQSDDFEEKANVWE